MANHDEYVLKDFNESTTYFNKLVKLYDKALEVFDNLEKRETNQHLIAFKKYLECSSKKMKVLQSHFRMYGKVENHYNFSPSIDDVESGFPIAMHIRYIQTMIDEASNVDYETLEQDINSIKNQILLECSSSHRIPRELQYKLSKSLTQKYILDNKKDIYGVSSEITLEIHDENEHDYMWHVHWSQYDTKHNMPVFYSGFLKESKKSKTNLVSSEEIQDEFISFLKNYSDIDYKMLSIAKNMDNKFPSIEPIVLKRMIFGPFYSNQYTKHNSLIKDILSGYDKGKEDTDWILSWTIETIRSKGVVQNKKGLFSSEEIKQVFDIDHYKPELMEAGVTEKKDNILLPYEAYQYLSDKEDLKFKNFNKWVITQDGTVLENM